MPPATPPRVARARGPPPSDPEQGRLQADVLRLSTTVGLKIGYEAAGSTSTFTLGYKRKELSVIPVNAGRFPRCWRPCRPMSTPAARPTRASAPASCSRPAPPRPPAARPEVRDVFIYQGRRRAGRLSQRGTPAVPARPGHAGLPGRPARDAKLPAVWRNAEALGSWTRRPVPARSPAWPHAARERYTLDLALLDADSADATTRLSCTASTFAALPGVDPEPEGASHGTHHSLHGLRREDARRRSSSASGSPTAIPIPSGPGSACCASRIAAPRRRPGQASQPRRSGAGGGRSPVASPPRRRSPRRSSTCSRPGRCWASTGR